MDHTLEAADAAHHLRGFMKLSDRHRTEPVVMERGEGVWVFDRHGRPYLEAMAGMWCTSLGFGNEELVEAAAAQMRKLPYYQVLTNKTHGPAAELAEKLAGMVPVPDAKVHFTVSGSEANDCLVKFLRYRGAATGRSGCTIIARRNSYHGVTLAASSLTGMPRHHALFGTIDGIVHVSEPHWFRHHLDGETEDEFVARLARELDDTIVAAGPDTVAGFVAEPVTGGGGCVVPPDGYYAAIQAVLERHGVPFCADEVITGFGRTGQMFASDTFGIRPSTLTIGKALSSAYLPIAGLVISGDIYDDLEHGSDQVGTFAHGSTYAGHPVAAAVALKTLELYESRRILEHVGTVSPSFQARIAALGDHPNVGHTRGVGLMGAVEFVSEPGTRIGFDPPGSTSAAVMAAAQNRGLILRALGGGDAVAVCPPLIITQAEIDELFDRLALSIADVFGAG